MAAPAFRQKAQTLAASGGTSIVTTFSSASLSGSLLTLALVHDDGYTPNTPSGWTALLTSVAVATTALGLSASIFYRTSVGQTSETVTFATTQSFLNAAMAEHTGLTNPVPFGGYVTQRTPPSAGSSIVPATPYGDGPMAVLEWCFMDTGGGPQSGDSISVSGTGFTLRTVNTSSGTATALGRLVAVGDVLLDTTAGTTALYPATGGLRFLFTGTAGSLQVGLAFMGAGSAPVADFTADPTSGFAPLAVQFTDISTNTPTSWAWDFGDGATATAQHPYHTFQEAGIYSVSMTATNAAGSGSVTKFEFVFAAEPSADVDLTQAVCYNGYCFSGITPSPTAASDGSVIERIDLSWVEAVGYNDKRALQDGKDAADVFLGERRVAINAGLYGSTRGGTFDELAALAEAFHPVNAFKADQTNLGFLPLDFYRPTADITTWPTSTFPSGIPLRMYCRPVQPVAYKFVRDETGGDDGKGMAIKAEATLWARDPRIYLQTAQSIAITTSTQTVTYRGDYESFPVVTFSMSAAGSSVATIVVAGGSVQIDLSGTTTGTYALDYMHRTITKSSDGTLQPQLFVTSFTQNFQPVKAGSTFRISALTGISSVTLDYREAFV